MRTEFGICQILESCERQKERLANKLVNVFCPVLTSLLEFPPLLPEFLLEVWMRPSLVIEVDAVADDGSRNQAHR